MVDIAERVMKYWKGLVTLLSLVGFYVGWCYAMFHGHVDPALYSTRELISLIIKARLTGML